jgi:Abortive infection C-terminus
MSSEEVRVLVSRLEGLPVPQPSPANASQAVQNALADAETLLQTRGAPRAIDRIHTALHGYLRNLCEQAGITFAEADTAQRLLKLLATQHPILHQEPDVAEFLFGILGPLVSVIDKINNARNTKSLAHPNEDLLSEPEAILVINVVRTLLTYLKAKLS